MTRARRLRIVADVSTCVGARQCALNAPAVFGHDDANLVVMLQPVVDDRPDVADAITMCPTGSLSAVDVTTGKTVYP